MPQLAPTDVGVPPNISAIEEQLRRLGFAGNPAGMMTMTPGPPLQGTPDPQSAVAAILAAQDAEFQKTLAARQATQDIPPPPPPPTDVAPPTNATQVDGGKESSSINPLWALPAAVAAAIAAKLLGAKGITRGAKAASSAPSSAAAAANAARGKVGIRGPGHTSGPHQPINRPIKPGRAYGPHQPQGPKKPPVQGPQQPLELTDVVPPPAAALPPPTLTQTDLPTLPDVLAQRARQMQRGGTAVRPEPKPPAVIPENVVAMDAGADLSGNELTKAIRIADVLKERRMKAAAKHAKRGRGAVAKSTNALLDPESAAFNTAASVVRQERPPSKTPKNLRPWESEPRKDYGQPVLPKKKGGRPKKPPVYKPLPEVAKQIGKKKVETALRTKRVPRSLSDANRRALIEEIAKRQKKAKAK